MQINELSKQEAGLNRVHLIVQLIPDNSKENSAINAVASGNASDEQKKTVEDPINKYCKEVAEHFILISANVGNNGETDLLLEQFGVGA